MEHLVSVTIDEFTVLDDPLSFSDWCQAFPTRFVESGKCLSTQGVHFCGVLFEVLSVFNAGSDKGRFLGVYLRDRIGLGIGWTFDNHHFRVFSCGEPFVIRKGDNEFGALGVRHKTEIGFDFREQFSLIRFKLFRGLVDAEVKRSGEGCISPWFSYLVMIAEGIGITREEGDDGRCERYERQGTKDV